MRVKVVVETFIDYMPKIEECKEISNNPHDKIAVRMVVERLLKDERHFIGLISDDYRILDICPVEVAEDF